MDNSFISKVMQRLSLLEKNSENAAAFWVEMIKKNGGTDFKIEDIKKYTYFRNAYFFPTESDFEGISKDFRACVCIRIFNPDISLNFEADIEINDNEIKISSVAQFGYIEKSNCLTNDINRVNKSIALIKEKAEIIDRNIKKLANIVIREGLLNEADYTEENLDEFAEMCYISSLDFKAAKDGVTAIIGLECSGEYIQDRIDFYMLEDNSVKLFGWDN